MKIEVRTSKIDNPKGHLRACASLCIDSLFAVNNISVIERKDNDGLFVSMPSFKTNKVDEKGKYIYSSIFFPVNKQLKNRLSHAILRSYKEDKPVLLDLSKNHEILLTDSLKAALADFNCQ